MHAFILAPTWYTFDESFFSGQDFHLVGKKTNKDICLIFRENNRVLHLPALVQCEDEFYSDRTKWTSEKKANWKERKTHTRTDQKES